MIGWDCECIGSCVPSLRLTMWSLACVSVLSLSIGHQGTRSRTPRMALSIKGHQSLPLTEPLKDYAEQKVGKHCTRYDELLTGTTLQMKVEHRGGGLHDSNHQGPTAHIAEITATCNDKHIIHVSQSSEDMYASLDKLAESFGRQLRKHKERKSARPSDAISLGEASAATLDAEADAAAEADEDGFTAA